MLDSKTKEGHILSNNLGSVLPLLHCPFCDLECSSEEEDFMWGSRKKGSFSVLAFTELLAVCTAVFGLSHYHRALQKCLRSDSALGREHFFPFHLCLSMTKQIEETFVTPRPANPLSINSNAQQVSVTSCH